MVNQKSIIKIYIQWMKKHGNEMPRFITRQMLQLNGVREFCRSFPTCEGYPFCQEHIGCMFRNKIPREW